MAALLILQTVRANAKPHIRITVATANLFRQTMVVRPIGPTVLPSVRLQNLTTVITEQIIAAFMVVNRLGAIVAANVKVVMQTTAEM